MNKQKKINIQKRDKKIYRLRQNGKTLQHIASLYSISRERTRQIYEREKEIIDNIDKWPPLKKMLSTRTKNCLTKLFGKNILNNPKKISAMKVKKLFRIKSLGKKSIKELHIALHKLGYPPKDSIE